MALYEPDAEVRLTNKDLLGLFGQGGRVETIVKSEMERALNDLLPKLVDYMSERIHAERKYSDDIDSGWQEFAATKNPLAGNPDFQRLALEKYSEDPSPGFASVVAKLAESFGASPEQAEAAGEAAEEAAKGETSAATPAGAEEPTAETDTVGGKIAAALRKIPPRPRRESKIGRKYDGVSERLAAAIRERKGS